MCVDANITEYIIPKSVTSIVWNAFVNCDKLSSIILPENVTSIDSRAFSSCYNLAKLIVHENNKVYSSVDGILFNKDKTELLKCPTGKEGDCFVPQSVKSIADGAFYNCGRLTSIIIPATVTNIDDIYYEYNVKVIILDE